MTYFITAGVARRVPSVTSSSRISVQPAALVSPIDRLCKQQQNVIFLCSSIIPPYTRNDNYLRLIIKTVSDHMKRMFPQTIIHFIEKCKREGRLPHLGSIFGSIGIFRLTNADVNKLGSRFCLTNTNVLLLRFECFWLS